MLIVHGVEAAHYVGCTVKFTVNMMHHAGQTR